ncbi:MAG: MCE family protein [Alphaproteobacteria bacterium]|nr:MCE family protein [Alphaproteobacteria bacterium]
MSSNSPRRNVLLGLFVTLGAIIVFAALFSIGTLRESLRSRIPVTSTFEEVKGLKPGDAVWYAGVTVGTVKRVSFEDGVGQVRVELRIDEKAASHIPSDALARIGSDSLIGNTIVVLYDGHEAAGPLEAGAHLEAGTSVSPEAVLAKFQESNENLLVITSNLREITTRLMDEESSVGRLISDKDLYDSIVLSVANLQTASANAQQLTSDAATFTAELNAEGNLPHDLVTDQSIHKSLQASTQSLEEATASASALLKTLEEDVARKDTPAGVLLKSEGAGEDLEATLESLNQSSQLLEEDLEALQHNFLLRRYFKKRAKEAEKERKKAEGGQP